MPSLGVITISMESAPQKSNWWSVDGWMDGGKSPTAYSNQKGNNRVERDLLLPKHKVERAANNPNMFSKFLIKIVLYVFWSHKHLSSE